MVVPLDEKVKENASLTLIEKTGLSLLGAGFLSLLVAALGWGRSDSSKALLITALLITLGSVVYVLKYYLKRPSGIRNDHIMTSSMSARGMLGWLIGVVFTGFYILMYWYTSHDWETNTPGGLLAPLVHLFDPVSFFLRGKAADKYYMYGSIYTMAILIMGFRMLLKYRHSRYQIVRTLSVMFFQLIFAFLIPSILAYFQEPERYLNYFWPLSYKDMFPQNVNSLLSHEGATGKFLLLWTAALSFIGTPVFTYFWGKRWYCSWVCGCGGLANTLGDPWRQLSSKKLNAWKTERLSIHSCARSYYFDHGVIMDE